MTAALSGQRLTRDDDARLAAALPWVARRARLVFHHQPPFQQDESIVDSMAAAFFLIFRGLRERGRTIVTNSKGFALNACRSVRNGRPMGLGSAPADVLDPLVRRKGRVHVQSLDVPVAGGWMDLAVEAKGFGPAETAAFRVDFSDWWLRQPLRHRRMMNLLAKGTRGWEVAQRFRLSQGRISQLRRRWAGSWLAFQEPSVVAKVVPRLLVRPHRAIAGRRLPAQTQLLLPIPTRWTARSAALNIMRQ